MLPSIVAPQLQDTLVDYIMATLGFDDEGFADAFEQHLRGPDGLFRGPYLRLGVPFASAAAGEVSPLEITPPFTPYAHQLQAFRQLDSRSSEARNTLVTTGTGSGKTECFLYPVLDHCWRNRHKSGVQAILIYPMNALATDQARRLAEIIHGDERLRGQVTAGLYVGGGGDDLPTEMSATRLIEQKKRIIDDPPHILLTNYKMLDFMLLRPNERRLWQHNGPTTLQYLVIDELHTFDGAQGSDVACLIRRLKARLGIAPNHLRCAGTSATIGSSTDPLTFEALADFASTVFGETFSSEGVVRETRLTLSEFLPPPSRAAVLPAAQHPDLSNLATRPGDAPAEWVEHQETLWLNSPTGSPTELGNALLEHPFFHHLLAATEGKVMSLPAIDAELCERVPAFAERDQVHRTRLLQSFLALVSSAKRKVGSHEMPLVTVQLQLWARELSRLLLALPDQSAGEVEPPRFVWHSDEPGGELAHEAVLAPQAHCRECGIHGLAAVQTEMDRERNRLTFGPGEVGTAWMRRHRDARFVWIRPVDPALREGELVYWLHPPSGSLQSEPFAREDGTACGVPVVLEATTRKGKLDVRFAARCPHCASDDALSIVGSRSASLTSVAVTHLYQTPFNSDKKLLAFTDSVQDACHRAGFFGGRTFRIHLRTAMQTVINQHETLPLSEAATAFEAHWRATEGDLTYLASFLPPDLRELPEVTKFTESGGKGSHKGLWNLLRQRLAWEFTREFGVAAGIGRSLERSAASTAVVDPERLEAATQQFTGWLREERLAAGELHPRHFLFGLVHRMRQMGAVHHPYLKRYVSKDGARFWLSKKKNPHMSPVGPRSKRLRFVASRTAGSVFTSPMSRRAPVGWFGDWMQRCLDWASPTTADLARVYGKAFEALDAAGIIETTSGSKGASVWGLKPEALLLTAKVSVVQVGPLGRTYTLGADEALRAHSQPAFAFREPAALQHRDAVLGYYASVYNRGETTRVFPGEHTGLLERSPRVELETRFKTGATPEDPQAPNLLVCTPTLEMGVDIGDLSAAMLCSVPPTPANYLQRVGRAGRKTGNALVFVMANSAPHDLYFHAEPELMLDGTVLPPGAYLGAVAMLKRQLTAWCMDQWAREDEGAGPIPHESGGLLSEKGQLHFPGRFLEHFGKNRARLLRGFLAVFDSTLDDDGRAELEAWVNSPKGLAAAVQEAFLSLKAQIDGYGGERDKARREIKAIQKDPTAVADAENQINELERYARMLQGLMGELRRRYPLNVLADHSVLPNYAFPERGVTLHSKLTSREVEADGETKHRSERRTYTRPAARALRELAPLSTFYAEGHKVQVRELDLGPQKRNVRHFRFCAACNFIERDVNATKPADQSLCPHCGDKNWADVGRVRPVLQLELVRALADRVRSTTIDDTEEREQRGFVTRHLFEVYQSDLIGGATLLPNQGFGFEYYRRCTMTELNLGPKAALEAGPKVLIAGDAASDEGFPTCPDCGIVIDPYPQNPRDEPPPHSFFCAQRENDTKPRLPLFLYRSFTSEALRFKLPFSEVDVERKLASFHAALEFGLRRRFKGRPMHLHVSSMVEPDRQDPSRSLHYLILLDSVPGGTGYLKEYRQKEAVFALLQEALDGLKDCPCRARGRDGCYLCLFGKQRQRQLPHISSQLAETMLSDILDHQKSAVNQPGGMQLDTSENVLESEFEERLVAWLEAHTGHDLSLVKKRSGVSELRMGDTTWEMRAQVDLSAEAGQPCRADFVLEAVQGPGLGERVVIEGDSQKYHVQPGKPTSRLPSDVDKRMALMSRDGLRLFAVTWKDLQGTEQNPGLPGVFVSIHHPAWKGVLGKVANGWPESARTALTALPDLSPMQLICAYLTHPGKHWEHATAALCSASLGGAALDKRLIDLSSYHRVEERLRSSPQALPLGPMGSSTRSGAKDLFSVASETSALGCTLSALGSSVAKRDATGMSVVLRLHDHPEARSAEDFAPQWRRFLHGMNVGQFLPKFEVITTAQVEADEALDAEEESVLGALGLGEPLAAEPEMAPMKRVASRTQLESALSFSYNQEAQAAATALFEEGLPAPDADPAELPPDGELLPDMTWADLKLALLESREDADEHIAAARALGWTLLFLPIDIETLRRHLRRSPESP